MGRVQPITPFRSLTLSRRLRIALVAWLAMLGLDFLLNGALFARMYQGGGAFFLAPGEAFRRIPFGYLAFLILAIAIVEIANRLRIATFEAGIRLGLAMGGVLAAVWSLSLYSIATLDALVAVAFALIWLALLVIGSAVAASGLARPSLRGLAFGVATFDVLCVLTVVGLQSFGLVQTVTP
jgi:hypothetical protein